MLSKNVFKICIVAVFLVGTVRGAEGDIPPKSLVEQVTYLEGALTESFRLRDLVMLDLAVKGFKAAKLGEKDLELSMLRAERNAAWFNAQQYGMVVAPADSIETWGLMTRAKLGSDAALQALRKLAGDLPPGPAPLPAVNTTNAADYHAKQIALAEYGEKCKLRGCAMFALALMKEPGIQDRALAAIQNKAATDHQTVIMGMYGSGTDPLILAVLEPDAEAGFTKLLAYCSDEKFALKDQASVLSELNMFLAGGFRAGAEEKFSVTQGIRQRLPKDAQNKLVAPFVSVVKRYVPDPNQPWDMTLNSIANIGVGMPANALIPDGVDAIEALTKRLPGPKDQYPKQQFVAILKKNGRDATGTPKPFNTPVKPPRPPEDEKNTF